jgi:TatD DNase family protein
MNNFIEVLRRKKPQKGVLHCFPGNLEEARKILNLGLLVSFTGLITFKADFDEVIKYVPLDRIMIETDCPFLAPEPYRGRRNEPAYVVEVARRIAEIKDLSLYKVAEATTVNAEKFFGI